MSRCQRGPTSPGVLRTGSKRQLPSEDAWRRRGDFRRRLRGSFRLRQRGCFRRLVGCFRLRHRGHFVAAGGDVLQEGGHCLRAAGVLIRNLSALRNVLRVSRGKKRT